MLGDIGIWFLAGVLIAGAISTFVPADFIAANLGQGFLPMLIMLVIAVPMYVCATATTPIAAALAIKGLSPGAALVFLLAGPATNMASLTVVSKILGKKATGIYLATILICSLAMGLAANWIYTRTGMSITAWIQKSGREHRSLLSEILAVALLALILKPLLQKYFFRKKTCDCDPGPDHSHEDSAH